MTTPNDMSRPMGKPKICIGENKGADQLRGNREADQRLCFRYSDSTIPSLLNSKISSSLLLSVTVQVGLCRTCSGTTLLVFPRGGSYQRKKDRFSHTHTHTKKKNRSLFLVLSILISRVGIENLRRGFQ